jgi:hypothetical protein
MEKKMIHRLLVSFVHTAPIDRYNMMLPKIVHAKNLSKGRRPKKKKKKKTTLKGALVSKMLFQEKREPSLQPRIL